MIVPPTDHTDHTEYRPVTKARKGQGGAHATTTTLWFALSEGNFDNSTPQDVVYTISGDESNEFPISLQKVHAVDYEEFDSGSYWHVYSVGIDEKTAITANGYVSFDLSSEPDDAVPYEYHVRVTVPVYHAKPVSMTVDPKNGDAEKGTTELTVTPANAEVKLARVWVKVGSDVESTLTLVVDGVVSITNRNNGNKSVTVEVRNGDGPEGSFDAGTSEGYYVGNEGYYVSQLVTINPAVNVVTFEKADGEDEKRGTTALKGIPLITGITNYSITIDDVEKKGVEDSVANQYTIENRSLSKANPVVSVELKKTPATNGYADFDETVSITPAVKAVTFEKGDGVKDVFGTTKLTAVNHVDKDIAVSIDGKTETIPPGGTTILAIKNNDVKKETVSVELTDSAANNGYYIQPASVDIVSAVKVERAYPFGTTTESYTDKTDTGYVYYFAVNPVFPASFLKPENVTVKSKEGTAGNVVKFCLAKDGGTEFIAEWLDKLVGNFEAYAIGFTLPSESSEVTFQFVTENENGFCISELPSKL